MSILGVVWRAALSVLLVGVTLNLWDEVGSARAEARAQVEKYQQLRTDAVIRPVSFDPEYFWREISDGVIRYELKFDYRDELGRVRKGEVATYSLPQDFSDQPVHFLGNDSGIHALDIDHTVAEKIAESGEHVRDAWLNFGFSLLVTLFCLAGAWMGAGPVPRTEADFLALDTQRSLKLGRGLARDGGEVLVATGKGEVRVRIPSGSRSGMILRVRGHGRRSDFDERVFGDAYSKLVVRRWPW